ncbi:MAG: hypothetical protein ACHQQS_04960 [Thermoanaerobaculales bacterium]
MRTVDAICMIGLVAAAASTPARGAAQVLRHPHIVIVSSVAEGAAPVATRAYAGAFHAVGYPVEWTTPDHVTGGQDAVVVLPHAVAVSLAPAQRSALLRLVEKGGWLVTAGPSELARQMGIHFDRSSVELRGIADSFAPGVEVRWKRMVRFRPFAPSGSARVFARAARTGKPIVVALTHGLGKVLFLGVELDEESPLGSSRFPFFLHAVGAAFGVSPALAAAHVTVYADLGDYPDESGEAIAHRWHAWGVGEAHLGAWDALGARAATIDALLASCHRLGIRVYAWLEPPEISSAFWEAHPEWRERTATGRDAHVDWRKLMALEVPACFAAASDELRQTLTRFDWDGVDLAEVYFESPQGVDAPDAFTPMHEVVRESFAARAGFDPQALFDPASPRHWTKDPQALARFLAYRREVIVELHQRLMSFLVGLQREKPQLDLVLTLVDALYDRNMQDFIAVDPSRIAALAAASGFSLQVEDPFTLWGLGPERYATIAADYAGLVVPGQQRSIDINVVERDRDTYPTAKQTGIELFQLASAARRHFDDVCFYSEATIPVVDRDLLHNALAAGSTVRWLGASEVEIDSSGTDELDTGGYRAAMVDGRDWPAGDGNQIILPRGQHRVAWVPNLMTEPGPAIRGLTGAALLGASKEGDALVVEYTGRGRAYLELAFHPRRIELDGQQFTAVTLRDGGSEILVMPGGKHQIRLGTLEH